MLTDISQEKEPKNHVELSVRDPTVSFAASHSTIQQLSLAAITAHNLIHNLMASDSTK
jgi:hypothetical protein